MSELASLPNLGAASAKMLAQNGIETIEQLQAVGAVAAYYRVKGVNSRTSLNLLWALYAALEGCAWNTLSQTTKAELLMQLEALDDG